MTTNFIKVFPTKASALNIPADAKHPKLTIEGVMWPLHDSFTKRRLRDKSVTTHPKEAYSPPASAMPTAAPPAAAEAPASEAPAPAAQPATAEPSTAPAAEPAPAPKPASAEPAASEAKPAKD